MIRRQARSATSSVGLASSELSRSKTPSAPALGEGLLRRHMQLQRRSVVPVCSSRPEHRR